MELANCKGKAVLSLYINSCVSCIVEYSLLRKAKMVFQLACEIYAMIVFKLLMDWVQGY